jgi:hypothetical protein
MEHGFTKDNGLLTVFHPCSICVSSVAILFEKEAIVALVLSRIYRSVMSFCCCGYFRSENWIMSICVLRKFWAQPVRYFM